MQMAQQKLAASQALMRQMGLNEQVRIELLR